LIRGVDISRSSVIIIMKIIINYHKEIICVKQVGVMENLEERALG